jgi:hypothetical protein
MQIGKMVLLVGKHWQENNMLIPLEISDSRPGSVGKTEYKTITMYDTERNREVKTYCVSTYGNYAKWKKVINYDLSKDTCLLTGTFDYSKSDVVDADSKFSLHPGVSYDDVADIIRARA